VKNGLSNNFVHSIEQDKTGKLWFASRGGVSCYDGKSFTDFKNTEGKNFYNARIVIEDKKGNILIGGDDGLNCWDGKTLTKLRDGFIGYIYEDKTGTIWLSEVSENNKMSLTRFDPSAKNGKSFTKIKSYNQVFGITEDFEGNIWFGTDLSVFRFNGKIVEEFGVHDSHESFEYKSKR
jgi:ligand-binding sensor domain-containing protein